MQIDIIDNKLQGWRLRKRKQGVETVPGEEPLPNLHVARAL